MKVRKMGARRAAPPAARGALFAFVAGCLRSSAAPGTVRFAIDLEAAERANAGFGPGPRDPAVGAGERRRER